MLPVYNISFPLLMLYAEIHYRFFPFFPSLLFKKEPEILFDIPHRIDPGKDLPILLILNDINRFPVELLECAVTLSQVGCGTELFSFNNLSSFQINHPLNHCQNAYLLTIAHDKLPKGELFVNAALTFKKGRSKRRVFNDNLPGSSRRAFRTYIAENYLPGSALCCYGDLHVHSQYSQSHVEFGPPITVIDRMAAACGLSFIGITDHSYDLSCSLSNYLEEDQSVKRWHLLQQETTFPHTFSTILIPGEEISCLNSRKQTVHLVGLGHQTFIPGSQDGARKKFDKRKDLSINQVISAINKQNGIAFAAHPSSKSGFLQRSLLNRGEWHIDDFNSDLQGIQPLNSGFSSSWKSGKLLWLDLLKQGINLALLAGNDAHGDFARYRAIKIPFLSIYEDFERSMGYAKTGIYGSCSNAAEVLQGIRSGATFVTTGPYLSINRSTSPESYLLPYDTTVKNSTKKPLHLHAISNSEFGTLRSLSLYGSPSNSPGKSDKLLFSKILSRSSFEETIAVDPSDIPAEGYIRAETESISHNGTCYRAFTSAILL